MQKHSKILKAAALAFALTSAPAAFAQQTPPPATSTGSDLNAVTTAVPILTVGPDSRSAALGDAGVALSPDANASYWNPAKLGFVQNDLSVSFSYSPWLRNIVDDMSLNYLSGYKKLNETSALAVSLMYFDLGEIQFIDAQQNPLQNYNPKEYAVAVSYGQALSENFSVGVTARFIHSNLAGDVNVSGSNTESQPGNTAAVDVGVYYNKDLSQNLNLALAGNISNIGGKIAYSEDEDKSFLPTNLKLGTALKYNLDAYNSLTLLLDANKLLVPSPGADTDQSVIGGIFSSFGDAEGGASEEMKEVNLSTGVEYWYNELFAARVGYFYEHPDKGGRKYFSAGLGIRYQKFGLDAAYLIPNDQGNPLADTWRFTLALNLE
ncbi:type IX secretion system outer membrane channel protein PorV [Pontibacter anaerobius]|uniref:Type IX secretion system outer membrane channel protein PorV n=1 Tax=Pontibacter anaerobius TaxID=2993940 RepID=A0ABT3RJR2_9BACT|nr:type IX secretion system outer membrane channel protein PorV [Pontibacter anaerobius]MCX2742103.1 type IX secretion system outer membrane channel protein PorV [Pontibacter anaerobius]